MAITTCVPCCEPQLLSRRDDSYKAAHLQILCDTLAAIEGSASVGGATAANQVLEIAQLTDINTALDGTLTVSGTVAATQSGPWSVTVSNGAGVAAVNIQDGGNSITVDGTVAATQSGTWNIGTVATITNPVAATQSGTWNITNISGTVSLPTGASTLAEQQTQTASLSVLDDWDESDRAKVNTIVGQAGVQGASGAVSANTQRVVLATDVALPAGTNAIGKLAANSGVDIGDVTVDNAAGTNPIPVQGNAAHDAPFAGNPVLMGAGAQSADPTAVTAGDATRLLATLLGKLVIQPFSLPARYGRTLIDNAAASGDSTIIAAPGAGSRLYITSLSLSADAATLVTWKDATTAIGYTDFHAAADPIPYTFPTPLRLGDNAAFVINSSVATQVLGHVTYYIAAE